MLLATDTIENSAHTGQVTSNMTKMKDKLRSELSVQLRNQLEKDALARIDTTVKVNQTSAPDPRTQESLQSAQPMAKLSLRAETQAQAQDQPQYTHQRQSQSVQLRRVEVARGDNQGNSQNGSLNHSQVNDTGINCRRRSTPSIEQTLDRTHPPTQNLRVSSHSRTSTEASAKSMRELTQQQTRREHKRYTPRAIVTNYPQTKLQEQQTQCISSRRETFKNHGKGKNDNGCNNEHDDRRTKPSLRRSYSSGYLNDNLYRQTPAIPMQIQSPSRVEDTCDPVQAQHKSQVRVHRNIPSRRRYTPRLSRASRDSEENISITPCRESNASSNFPSQNQSRSRSQICTKHQDSLRRMQSYGDELATGNGPSSRTRARYVPLYNDKEETNRHSCMSQAGQHCQLNDVALKREKSLRQGQDQHMALTRKKSQGGERFVPRYQPGSLPGNYDVPSNNVLMLDEGRRNVMIGWTGYRNQRVEVAGTWDAWKRKIPLQWDFNQHYAVIDLKRGEYHYKYIVNGKWTYDPNRAKIDDGQGSFNNYFTI
eukprot:CFRG2848T1